jgi:hypothetical protein
MRTKLTSRAFRDAAERIASEQNRYCCDALSTAQGIDNFTIETPCHILFREAFEPVQKWDRYGWWHPEDREARILALLLCAEMCKR